jgi:hypothetical protein
MMNYREPALIHKTFAQLRNLCDPRGHDLLNTLEEWMLFDNTLLRMQHRLTEVEQDEPDLFSRKVPEVDEPSWRGGRSGYADETPVLKLVGDFRCNPDESCGEAS